LVRKFQAGGVDPFSGSTDIVRAANETAAGKEFKIYLDDADAAIRAGDIALASNLAAAQQAKTSGKLDAATKLLMAGATAGKGGGFDRTSYNYLFPAPVETGPFIPYQKV